MIGHHCLDPHMPIKAVCFDVGETLIDETRHWEGWAEFLGVPRLTLFSAYGVLLERGQSLRRLFEIFRPDLDFADVRQRRLLHYDFLHTDLYPDAIPALTELRARGYRVVIAGNQPVESEAALTRLGVPAHVIASSAGWGVQKPDPRFFEKVAEAAGVPAEQIAYVGDRVDNDVVPSRAAGMTAVFLRRGPWGWMHEEHPEIGQAHLRLTTLIGLADALDGLA
jgi:HAD superfamily hydrolase (TIGR01662 family)